MTRHVVIVGAGRIGQTLAAIIERGPAEVTIALWDKNPRVVQHQQPLETVVAEASDIFCCMPSWAVREVLQLIVQHLRASTRIVTLAKGCEASTGKTMAEVADEILGPAHPHGVLGGPMISETLSYGHRGIGVIASQNHDMFPAISALFAGTNLSIVRSLDPRGVALAGVMKNIYAFLVGITVGLDWPADQQHQFLTLARQEFLRSSEIIGLPVETCTGPAGLEDFEETATSPSSYNRRIGSDLGRTGHLPSECEATVSWPSIRKRLADHRPPLLETLNTILSGQQPPSILSKILTTSFVSI